MRCLNQRKSSAQKMWHSLPLPPSMAIATIFSRKIRDHCFRFSNYGATKLASEALLSGAAESFLHRVWIFRFPNVVGPRATHGVIVDFLARLAQKPNRLEVLGDGSQTKPYLHVTELIEAMRYIVIHAEDRRNVFNIAPDEVGTSVAFLAEQVIARVRTVGLLNAYLRRDTRQIWSLLQFLKRPPILNDAAGPFFPRLEPARCAVLMSRVWSPISQEDAMSICRSRQAAWSEGIQQRLLFFYTGLTRSASGLLQQQSEELAADGRKSENMSDMVRLAEAAYADLCAGKLESLGQMLHGAWHIKKQMTNGISNTLIDEAYQAAIEAGAEGGKLLGAGGGGFLMFMPHRSGTTQSARTCLAARGIVPLRLARQQYYLCALTDRQLWFPSTNLYSMAMRRNIWWSASRPDGFLRKVRLSADSKTAWRHWSDSDTASPS